MEVIGTLKKIEDTKTFGAKGFRKREVVILTEEQYPQPLMIEFVQDKCDLLDRFSAGQSVKISINLRGREWENPQGEVKYFNSIQGWRIESNAVTPSQNLPEMPAGHAFPPADAYSQDEADDLPF
ncbi:MAG: DUF3127 domain-containing protein [Flavobacteriaceae bacterium]|jgi:hypothetical protein|nr:DUF3127 domain-containing protein [Flavobacteriaceae bacterium]MDP4674063.1 DUF3127 domain-containing protein [Flavobacteriaceae bacterium]MDP4754484.1 DUF3127 domain-containing protein [Flavobacteriaceae bacterium]MDP4794436.1 DUF3127 domain-containing protein [Flavobacteriaceae bacterium]MDP4885112.1 DUF3127 domain-containing protein [Flavobacteriaceae bacterium]